jgi:hypothetical protein
MAMARVETRLLAREYVYRYASLPPVARPQVNSVRTYADSSPEAARNLIEEVCSPVIQVVSNPEARRPHVNARVAHPTCTAVREPRSEFDAHDTSLHRVQHCRWRSAADGAAMHTAHPPSPSLHIMHPQKPSSTGRGQAASAAAWSKRGGRRSRLHLPVPLCGAERGYCTTHRVTAMESHPAGSNVADRLREQECKLWEAPGGWRRRGTSLWIRGAQRRHWAHYRATAAAPHSTRGDVGDRLREQERQGRRSVNVEGVRCPDGDALRAGCPKPGRWAGTE